MHSNKLIENLNKLHTTDLGVIRIKRNLALTVEDVVDWCKEKIQDENACIMRKGKNWYVEIEGYRLTINATGYTIITAHRRGK